MHLLQAVQTDTGCNVWLDNDAKKFRNDSLSQPVLTVYTPRVSPWFGMPVSLVITTTGQLTWASVLRGGLASHTIFKAIECSVVPFTD